MAHNKNPGLFQKVYDLVQTIPKGKVATYGQVAKILELQDVRKIGWALHANSSEKTPCHRVVNKEGEVAENFAFDGWREQKRRLVAEGVAFISEKKVDLERHQWNPN
jgi:methylated-DNA-protein-cysteine methyltransferase-like protein